MTGRVNLGDTVRLRRIPRAVEECREQPAETEWLLSKAVGQVFTVRGWNNVGMVEIWIRQDGRNSESACDDSVWIEPEYLEVVAEDEA